LLGPIDFTDFTGDPRLLALIAKDFLSNLGDPEFAVGYL